MTEQRTDEFNQVRSRMAGDIKTVIVDGEDLIKAAANVTGASLAAAREKIDEKLNSAGAALIGASRPTLDKAKSIAAAANGHVRDNPWNVIGVAAAAGVLLGFLLARRARDADSSDGRGP